MQAEKILKGAFQRHKKILEDSDVTLKDAAHGAEIIESALQGGKKVLACGNGGSAADAEHFIGELVCKYKDDRKSLPGISLVSGVAALTAIGNDYGFEDIFRRQIQALGNEGDVLVAISTSGSSKNVLSALEVARKHGLKTILLTGAKGSSLADKADVIVAVPSEETARIQEMHELIYHAWCEFLDA